MGAGNLFGTHLCDLGLRSLSYWSGTEFDLSEPLIQSLQNLVGISPLSCHLIKFGRNSIRNFLGEISQLETMLMRVPLTLTFDIDFWPWIFKVKWPWIFKVKLYVRKGRPNCHGTKGTGVNRMPWCETQPLCELKAGDTFRDQADLRCRHSR